LRQIDRNLLLLQKNIPTMGLKRIFICVALIFSAVSMFAQDNSSAKATVIVDYFYVGGHVRNNEYKWVDMLRNDIIHELVSTGRVTVVDAANEASLNYAPLGYNETNANNRLNTLRTHGGKYVVEGDIDYVDIRRISNNNSRGVRSKNGDDAVYDTRIGYTLRLIDISTGEILGQTKSDPEDGSVHTSSPEKSMETVTGRAATAMRRMLINDIAITGQVLEVINTKAKKGVEEAKTVAVNVGTGNGAAEGVKFDVFISREIAGHKVSDKIGQIKISEVKGQDISYADVRKGGADILAAMRSGAKLTIKSSKAGFWD
jgi:curli biogenesis system outer membrane secretion channel CsgG